MSARALSDLADVLQNTPWAFRNRLLNPRFDIWQEGVSFSSPATNTYTADQWVINYDGSSGTFAVTKQAHTLGDAENEPASFLRWDQTVAGSGDTYRTIKQKIEGVRSFAGQKCIVSFLAKADSAQAINLNFAQSFGTGGSPSSDVVGTDVPLTLSTSLTKYTAKFTIPSISGKTIGSNLNDYLAVVFKLPINATFTFEVSDVQCEMGVDSTKFEVRPLSYEIELCQRFFEKSYNVTVDPAAVANEGAHGFRAAFTTSLETIQFKTSKRAAPTMVYYNPATGASGSWRDVSAAADRVATSDTIGLNNVIVSIAATVDTNPHRGHWTANARL